MIKIINFEGSRRNNSLKIDILKLIPPDIERFVQSDILSHLMDGVVY